MKYSILHSKQTILQPNSQFERRVILQYYLDNDLKIDTKEREILLECVALEPENIGIIGCLLNDKTPLNTLRLAIGSANKSNKKLANLSTIYLENLNIDTAHDFYFIEKDYNDLTAVEIDVTNAFITFYNI